MNKKLMVSFSVVVVVLGIFTCLIVFNPGLFGGNEMASQQAHEATNSNSDSFESTPEANPIAGKILKFSTKDTKGNSINSEIFKEHDITLINLWSVGCNPCIEEMPELEKISKKFEGKVRVLGLVSEQEKDEAKDILKQKNISYTNLLENKELTTQITKYFDYIPVTLVVNKEGKILDEFVPGGADYEHFKKIITKALKNK
ncbi:TlpA disulfide reductase family protein [Clostridiaceae bacterium M8S5]|nr:TlpA disulfide reductase family protein [Clostridiaceae bacterium M8S5]